MENIHENNISYENTIMKVAKNVTSFREVQNYGKSQQKIKFAKINKNKIMKILEAKPQKTNKIGNDLKNSSEMLNIVDWCKKRFYFKPSDLKCLRKATREDLMYNGSFHEAIAPVLVTAQCFAVMPVIGIKGKTANDLYFSWKSIRTLYSLTFVIFLTAYLGLTINLVVSYKIKFDSIVPIIFHGSVLYVLILFIFLAKNWPQLMTNWSEVENHLPPRKCQKDKDALAHQIKIISITVLTLSLTEHILSIISLIHNVNYCPGVNKEPIKDFFMAQLYPLFFVTSFSPYKAFFGKILNVLATFTWNFMDLFVMLISVGLSARFKQLNEILFDIKGKQIPEAFWAKYRTHYRELCNLCEEVDNAISKITIISFSNNLFFICYQLLRSLKKMSSFAHAFYFWFSLLFLIGRTLAVSLYSAEINDESKRPVIVFRAVPKESWCLEVKRFSEEVASDIVALSGMKFFHLTRKLILSVAGTIVTYELVLIQFNQDEEIDTGC